MINTVKIRTEQIYAVRMYGCSTCSIRSCKRLHVYTVWDVLTFHEDNGMNWKAWPTPRQILLTSGAQGMQRSPAWNQHCFQSTTWPRCWDVQNCMSQRSEHLPFSRGQELLLRQPSALIRCYIYSNSHLHHQDPFFWKAVCTALDHSWDILANNRGEFRTDVVTGDQTVLCLTGTTFCTL